MTPKQRLMATGRLVGILALFLGLHLAVPIPAVAQCSPPATIGFNAVYGNYCGSTPALQGTLAFIDATQYSSSGDICQAIAAVFTAYVNHNFGVVVDARGFGSGTTQPCSTSPWASWSAASVPSTVVLLPSGTITMFTSWVLPSNTRIIGEGSTVTVLQACMTSISGCPANFSGDMIDMGTSSACASVNDCAAISVERLALNGNNVAGVNGIVNQFSQELTYVDDVAFTQISGTALTIATNYAANSGPYTNLAMSNVGTCLSISGGSFPLTDTRGVHGLTCAGATSSAAIYLDAPNNSLNDVYISGSSTQDGVLLGSNYPAENNVLINIRGSGLKNVVHISATTNSTPANCPYYSSGSTTFFNVCDVTILGVSNSGGANSTTIQDDLTGSSLTEAYTAFYVVGEPVQTGNTTTFTGIGNSRLTTSRHAPAWLVGTQVPANGCEVGALYSRTAGGTTTLYGCYGGTPSNGSWVAID